MTKEAQLLDTCLVEHRGDNGEHGAVNILPCRCPLYVSPPLCAHHKVTMLTIEERWACVAFRKYDELSARAIARKLGCQNTTVTNILELHALTGNVVPNPGAACQR